MEDNKENREQVAGSGKLRPAQGFLGAAAAVAKGLLPPPKPETLDEVFAEIRKAGPPFEWSKVRFDGWLVRAEAAAKRDMVEAVTRAATDAVNLTNEKWQREKTVARNVTVSGNAAVMREALIATVKLCSHNNNDLGSTIVRELLTRMDMIKAAARAALAKPPRNCDVGTAEEQNRRYERFCDGNFDHNDPDARCGGCPLGEADGCILAWAQMPYEEGGAE